MNISSMQQSVTTSNNTTSIKTNFTQKLSKDEVSEIKSQIDEQAKEIMLNSITAQTKISTSQDQFKKDYEEFQSFLKDVGYEGKSIATLSKDEASQLVSEDGFFGVKQTSQRMADFVINGSGGDEDMMRAGREGMIKGFKQAEAMWGSKLPEISQETMQKALEMVDMAMAEKGYSIINQEV